MGIHQPSSSNFNTKLILWQFDRLQREPLEGVNAAPLEHDLFTWHGNFYWPDDHKDFPNLMVHFVLSLPHDFPNSTPHMELLTSFRHSHVFGGSICFSLLKEFEDHFRGLPDTVFWNPARSIRSLLESVHVFLTVDEDAWCTISKQEGLETVRRAQQVRCAGCGHCPSNVFPPEEQWLAARVSGSNNNDTEQQVCALAMHQDLTETDPKKKKLPTTTRPPLQSVQYKSKYAVTEITAATTTAGAPLNLRADGNDGSRCFDDHAAVLKAQANQALGVTDNNLLSREAAEDFKCSVSGVSFDHSPNVVLGFGVNVVRRAKDGSIESITSDLVPVSMEIFYQGRIRKSALGATLTHFLPFAINEHHWKRAQRVLPGCVGAILGEPERKLAKTWEDRLLFVVGELWKSMAVLMMQGGAHASEKVLKGFCALHHILLLSTEETDATLSNKPVVMAAAAATSSKPATTPITAAKEDNGAAQEDSGEAKTWTMVVRGGTRAKAASAQRESSRSGLKALADTRVQNFVRYPRMRHKAQCPDFGRFLPLILLSSVAWDDVKAPFLQELLTRNARWICKAQRSLAFVKPQARQTLSNRAKQSWAASATGLKLTAFQVRFALSVAPWATEALPKEVVAVYERARQPQLMVRAMYNLLGGRPTPAMLCRFQEETKRIESLTSFEGFFETVNMPLSEMEIQQMLCDAMEKSEKFGYHRL